MRKLRIMAALLLSLSVVVTACSGGLVDKAENDSEEAEYVGEKFQNLYYDYFDTVCQIVGYEEEEESFNEASALTEDLLKHYNDLYDIYHSYEGITNVCDLNKRASEGPVAVEKDLMDLLLYGKEIYSLTNGKTNIAMGAVLKIWHNYREAGIDNPAEAALPDMDELKEASEHCNIEDVVLDEENMTVYFADPMLKLDVGAIAKGYATERVAEALTEAGHNNYALNFGGNARLIGPKSNGEAWTVGIQNPDLSSDETYAEKIKIADLSLVTSGSYQRYYLVDGVTYHHIINPDTLMPENYFWSVSILTRDSGLGDALSTALFNMTYDEGLALVSSLDNVETMWIYPDGSKVYTEGFKDYIITE